MASKSDLISVSDRFLTQLSSLSAAKRYETYVDLNRLETFYNLHVKHVIDKGMSDSPLVPGIPFKVVHEFMIIEDLFNRDR
jgi:hypothetical protein